MSKATSNGRTDVGRVRGNNEDSLLILDELGFYAVADGVGGRAAGEVASRLAVDSAAEFIRAWRANPELGLVEAAQGAVEAACRAVYQRAESSPRLRGMLSTLTLVVIDEDCAAMAHVGDSRLYLVRDGRVDQLSTDHTLAAEFARRGLIDHGEVESHTFAHTLTRTVGEQPLVVVDTLEFELVHGDVLVLTTDGVNPVMREPEWVLARLDKGGRLADQLIEAANAAGGRDNSSVVVVRPRGVKLSARSAADYLRAAEPFARLSTAGMLSVVAAGQVRKVANDEVVFEEGGRVDRMVVVLEGKLGWTVGESSRRLGPGECMGVSALFQPTTCPGTLIGHGRAQILVLDGRQLGRIIRRRPRLGSAVMRGLSVTLAELVQTRGDGPLFARGF